MSAISALSGGVVWEQPLSLHRPGAQSARAALVWLDSRPAAASLLALAQTLHPAEQEALAAVPSPARQQGFLLGRLAARRALSLLLGEQATAALHIRPGVFGQPEAWQPDGSACRYAVSISHRNGLACALAFPREQPMGIDVECVDPSAQDAMAAQMSPAEFGLLSAQPAAPLTKTTGLTLLWCAHEALGKALRCGLTVPPSFLEVSHLAPDQQTPPLPGTTQPGWRGDYRHWLQYGLQAWQLDDTCLAIALPRQTRLRVEPA